MSWYEWVLISFTVTLVLLFLFGEPNGLGRIRARVIADSINPAGKRIITVEGVFNRYLLAEFNTHRIFSRNSASSRAIPVKKILSQVWSDPALPIHWGANQAGMQARGQLTGWRLWMARKLFLAARIPVIAIVWILTKLKLHKQVANRLLEPWVWHTIVFTGTNFDNFFKLRLHPDAQPEFQEFARCVKFAIESSNPRKLNWGDWHMPYLLPADWAAVASMDAVEPARDENGKAIWPQYPEIALISSARCAATSYLRQGEKRDPLKDIELSDRLRSSGHWSPFEHVAQAVENHERDSNFDAGWKQLRKFFPGEDGTNG